MSIGKLFHIIHMTGDLPSLEKWYDQVFEVRRGMLDNHYMAGEKRDASLVLLGDRIIEPLAPAFTVEGWDAMPLGRFYQRFGNHWHSIAWYTDDVVDIWQRCTDNGIRVFVEGGVITDEPPAPGAAIMTHPPDTAAQLEFMRREGTPLEDLDPRFAPAWDPLWWADNHPLGLKCLAYTTVLTRDLARAVHIYVDVLGGTLLNEAESGLTGTRDVHVLMGDTVVQLSTPARHGTLASDDIAANGEIHHAAAFSVVDLDRAAAYLQSRGLIVLARDETTLLTDPSTTHGAPFRWTVAEVPGAPVPTAAR